MIISVRELAKRYFNELIFKKLTHSFSSGESYAITGPNGSGKSTLLKVLSGVVPQTKGEISFQNREKVIGPDDWFKHIAFISPYLELLEEFTLREFLEFHSNFKSISKGYSIDEIISLSFLSEARNKQIRFFSSGMKQRLKLTLAFYFENEIIFLDEPTTNLDSQGFEWYQKNIEILNGQRLLFIASNQLKEYEMCSKSLNILDYKE